MNNTHRGPGLGPLASLVGSRITVTGGAGFIGSHVATRLIRAGVDVTIIDDLSSGSLGKLADVQALGLDEDNIRIVDVRSEQCAQAIREWRPDVVVHLAAQASLPAAVRSPVTDADINIRGTVNVLEACVRGGVGLFVFAASAAIYGQVDPSQLPVTEQTAIAPTSPYGMSKAAALDYVNWYQRHHNLAATALALGNVYGPRQSGPRCGVIPQIANDIVAGVPASISGDGQQTRDFVYVSDVADAVALACTRSGIGLLNIASGIETSITQVHDAVCAATSSVVAPAAIPAVPGEARRMVFDISRAWETLGWQPTVELATGIDHVVQEAQAAVRATA
ncbi:NAD-dependent epimerase/dehydratase family protein [Nocardia nepalensis]|uniref:NAD-dependent epimerase/dehydratase family protein n=1 Tax=Nocardia nepalensis TaxID=3375448 RepID=UPI003B66E5BB